MLDEMLLSDVVTVRVLRVCALLISGELAVMASLLVTVVSKVVVKLVVQLSLLVVNVTAVVAVFHPE
ncbi:uncharacterized protein BCR38DRAFT_445600 [Pseudomassariella vexata]|uniref:Uncharacterized protein n=1 Tax=Pseudomassariella vexata TaxID=1141098 RepID=A0A1Y2DIM8_9PEZI|nr:uncharacterized protein BCR38DRAFT_445600 [Pseudomassariella vexata]ORY59089.1 hypothetical protein BCR38DRAFT_445600 [Pseudomassariella vexata]